MPKIVFTEAEKNALELLDRGPTNFSQLKEQLNQEFSPQTSNALMRTLGELKKTGHMRTIGETGLGLTEKGHRVVDNNFEEEYSVAG